MSYILFSLITREHAGHLASSAKLRLGAVRAIFQRMLRWNVYNTFGVLPRLTCNINPMHTNLDVHGAMFHATGGTCT